MHYKEPKRNIKGQPICEICGGAYDKLLQHVNLSHGLTAKEYKKRYNLNPRKGVQVKRLTSSMRKRVKANFKTVVMENLIVGGKNTRFHEGNTMTNTNMVREIRIKLNQERNRDMEQIKDELFLNLASKLRTVL